MVKEKIMPVDWASDKLSRFLDDAHHNILASFSNIRSKYNRLKDVDGAFRKIAENLINVQSIMPAFFLFRTHSSYLGAVRLALSGQAPETYMVLRGCLENSLYALRIFKTSDAGEIWLRRHDDENSLKRCKEYFKIAKVFQTLETEDKKLCHALRTLYETTIDFGGHPNELSLSSIMRQSEDGPNIRFTVPYLIDYRLNPEAFNLGLKSTARAGVGALLIFKIIYRERFDILGISDSLEELTKDL